MLSSRQKSLKSNPRVNYLKRVGNSNSIKTNDILQKFNELQKGPLKTLDENVDSKLAEPVVKS